MNLLKALQANIDGYPTSALVKLMNDPIVIIEANECCPNIPRSINNFAAYEAAHAKGLPWKIIPYENLESLSSTEVESAIPSGTIKFVNWFFEAQGLKYPNLPTYPEELLTYLGRTIQTTTPGELFIKWALLDPPDPPEPLFIKPVRHKAFTGFVTQPRYWVRQVTDINPHEPVYISKVIEDIQSEWRVFVLDGKILDIRPYRQEINLNHGRMPSLGYINSMINRFTSAPRAYSLDVALVGNKAFYEDVMETSTTKELLIEANDSLALGSYGLNSCKYLDMLIARWEEIRT